MCKSLVRFLKLQISQPLMVSTSYFFHRFVTNGQQTLLKARGLAKRKTRSTNYFYAFSRKQDSGFG